MDIKLLPPEFRNNDRTEIKDFTFQNTGYKNTRLNKRILIIDSGSISNSTTFSLDLQEKFRIDRKSDIYLDSITTHNCQSNADTNRIGFLLTIDEFNNNNSYSNTSGIHNRIFIPNDSTAGGQTTVTHKGKKLNYVGTINPTELRNLNITLTDLNSTPASIFEGSNASRFLIELIFVENE